MENILSRIQKIDKNQISNLTKTQQSKIKTIKNWAKRGKLISFLEEQGFTNEEANEVYDTEQIHNLHIAKEKI